MKRSSPFKIALILMLAACGGGKDSVPGDPIGKSSEQLFNDNKVNIHCNGQGAEFSGNYLFKTSNAKIDCDNKDLEDEVKGGINEGLNFKCTQQDSKFSCVDVEDSNPATNTISGCISSQGQYKLSSSQKDQVLEAVVIYSGEVGKSGFATGWFKYTEKSKFKGSCSARADLSAEPQ